MAKPPRDRHDPALKPVPLDVAIDAIMDAMRDDLPPGVRPRRRDDGR